MGQKAPRKVSSYLSGFLRSVNQPQRIYFLIYLIGQIWLVKFRSIREIAHAFGNDNTDGLHQFLKASPKKIQRPQEENQRQISCMVQEGHTFLILDDTSSPRKGKKIEGLGIHHGADGFVKGLCAVTSILKIGTQRFVWAIRGYRPKGASPKGAFKSKIQLVIKILSEAIQKI